MSDRQLSVHILDRIIVGVVADSSRTRDDLARIGAHIRLAACQCDARQGIVTLQTLNGHIGVEITRIGTGRSLLTTVVGVILVNCRDCQLDSIDRQVAIYIRDFVVAGVLADGGCARHNNSRISAGICFLAGQSDARQSVVALQAFHRHVGVKSTRVGAGRTLGRTVVRICLRQSRDRQSRLVDRQVAFHIRDFVVVGVRADSSCARNNLIGVGALVRLAARQGDARQSVAALQAFHRHIGVESTRVRAGRTLGGTVVRIGLVFGSDRQSRLVDRQVAFNIRNSVVAGVCADGGRTRDDLIGVGALVRLAARQGDARQSVAALQASHRHVGGEALRVCAGRTLGGTVVCVGLVISSDRQSRRRNFKRTVRNLNSICRPADTCVVPYGHCEIFSSQVHIVGSHILTCRLSGVARCKSNGHPFRSGGCGVFTNNIFNSKACRALISAIICLRVSVTENQHFKFRLPHCVQVVVRIVLISSHLSGDSTILCTLVLRAIPNQEIGSAFRNGSCRF